MRRTRGVLVVAILAGFVGVRSAEACVTLPAVLSDGMVLQQSTSAALWGSTQRREVTVFTSWDGNRYSARADAQGRWSLRVQTPEAGGPHRIIFCPGEAEEMTVRDVLAGEVWLASGQSNMAFTLARSAEADTEIPRAANPHIRFLRVPRKTSAEPLGDAPGAEWIAASPDTAGSFSAVAYHFARELHARTGAPVGIIESSWGGSVAEAWTPRPVLEADPRLRLVFERWRTWQADTASADPEARETALYMMARPHREPVVLFNAMIAPIDPFTLRGFLWYQGESNVRFADEYRPLLARMISAWREAWGATLPFYIVELPPYRYEDMNNASLLREAQQEVTRDLEDVHTLSILDMGDMADIHPTRKREVGERLARLALARTYDRSAGVVSGPVASAVEVDGERIRIRFDHADGGLAASGGRLTGFEISGRDDPSAFHPAEARIEGGSVVVWSENVPAPAAVRYAWGEQVAGFSLFNGAGLPAAPFRLGAGGR